MSLISNAEFINGVEYGYADATMAWADNETPFMPTNSVMESTFCVNTVQDKMYTTTTECISDFLGGQADSETISPVCAPANTTQCTFSEYVCPFSDSCVDDCSNLLGVPVRPRGAT